MKFKLTADVDLDEISSKIEEEVESALDSISGVGPDGTTDYEVTSITLSDDPKKPGSFTIEVEVERVQGKFASKDEVAEEAVSALESIEITLPVEVTY